MIPCDRALIQSFTENTLTKQSPVIYNNNLLLLQTLECQNVLDEFELKGRKKEKEKSG